ncbi:glycine betaine ABC transporter substrate-binding protein [Piscinibacter koreensis]|uniref:ABC transporter permease subunit n=1 Tax=Piscinibacter koreensis TaxID=2742824 RepID=A0A7Y6NPJ7_9BURK|nr:glycine betaine ABC transporter substrate-binding protein [Schlegelella koreensis]NUZ07002.1 ABC transporter permease subunit [Schlegelella koreensis]
MPRVWLGWLALALGWALLAGPARAADQKPLVVGSKRFTESYVLGEILTQTLIAAGRPAVHKAGLGNTGILEQALASGAVDLYPEYTGTIVRELLRRDGNPTLDELNRWLAARGLRAGVPLGFGNTYALAMTAAKARALGITRISDLFRAGAPKLALGLSHEFLERADGWPALARAYGARAAPLGLDHGLAYDALLAGRVDVIDVYSTDAKLGRLGLTVLADDRGFFPAYDAVVLMRAGVDAAPLARLAGAIDTRTMIAMNAAVELDRRSFAETAATFLAGGFAGRGAAGAPTAGDSAAGTPPVRASARSDAPSPRGAPDLVARVFAPDFARLAGEHLLLVFGSLALGVAVGVPLGVAAWRWPRAEPALLGAVAVLQTIPSLALLAFLIAWLDRIGVVPALVALFLYALLPIVRNTHTGLQGVSAGMAQAAASLGLTPRQALLHVQLPLAAPTLLAGVKTAAVINVGTATMAAFIGAGGFGERIVAGLAVNDSRVMLAGALPAAALALLVQAVFDLAERRVRGARRR